MVEITTLGSFSIKINGETVSENFKKTLKLLQFLDMLILNINKPISVNLICDTIWKEDSVNTNKALQNLVHRLRNIFADGDGPGCIVYHHKTYTLIPTPDWKIDIQIIEDLFSQAVNPETFSTDKIGLLEKIIEIYNGEYMLYSITGETHSYAAANRYRRMFIEAVCMLSDLYIERNEYDKMLLVCDKAIALEPLQEPVYIRMAKSMQDSGKISQAVTLIEGYFDILYREMGIRASDALNEIYSELKGKTDSSKRDIAQIYNGIKEISSLNKPLFCGFDAFKDVYRYEARQLSRSGKSLSLLLIDIYGKKGTEIPNKQLPGVQKSLRDCCMQTFRKGDAFAECSPTQVVVMLIISKAADSDTIVSRLSERFYAGAANKNLFLKFSIQNQTAADE